jgi:hypothetical protein
LKPQSAKNKGRLLQQYVRNKLLEAFPELEADDVKSTSMGAGGEDVQLSPAARRRFPYQIECKSKATSQIHTYFEQAESHGKHTPLVVVKKDRGKVLAIVALDHFLELLQENNNKNRCESKE